MPTSIEGVKPFKTYAEQLQILKDRHLIIPDENKALEQLRELNYYRFSAYSLTLSENDEFYPNVTFDDILELYEFDCDLRELIMKYTSSVEVSLRAYIAYYHAKVYGPLGYLNSMNFESEWSHADFLAHLSKLIYKSKDVFIQHHRQDKGGIYPLWVAIEELTFGSLSLLYKNLKKTDRRKIAQDYYGMRNEKYIENWMQCAVVARNIAAHSGRFYNRINLRPAVLLGNKTSKNICNNKPFAYLYAISKLLPKDKNYGFTKDLKRLFKKHPFAEPRYLGFPNAWEKYL